MERKAQTHTGSDNERLPANADHRHTEDITVLTIKYSAHSHVSDFTSVLQWRPDSYTMLELQ